MYDYNINIIYIIYTYINFMYKSAYFSYVWKHMRQTVLYSGKVG